MPSTSQAQKRTMQAVAHDPKFAKKMGIPQSVGKDFEAADKAAGPRKLPKHAKSAAVKKKKLPKSPTSTPTITKAMGGY